MGVGWGDTSTVGVCVGGGMGLSNVLSAEMETETLEEDASDEEIELVSADPWTDVDPLGERLL